MPRPRIRGRGVLSDSIHSDGSLPVRATRNPRMNRERTGCQSIVRRRMIRAKSLAAGTCFRCGFPLTILGRARDSVGGGRPSRENQPGASVPNHRRNGKQGRTQLLSCCNLAIMTRTTQRLMNAFGARRGPRPPNWRKAMDLRPGCEDSFCGCVSLTGCEDGAGAHREVIP